MGGLRNWNGENNFFLKKEQRGFHHQILRLTVKLQKYSVVLAEGYTHKSMQRDREWKNRTAQIWPFDV